MSNEKKSNRDDKTIEFNKQYNYNVYQVWSYLK